MSQSLSAGVNPGFVFVVEDGTMVPNSNSYVPVDYADRYISQNIHAWPAWNALDTLTQQQLLAWGSRYLDERATWNGIPSDDYLSNPTQTNVISTWASPPIPTTQVPQSMRWPRAGCVDVDNTPVPYNVIPKQLMDATCEMARYLITTDRSLERPQDGLTELRVDVITIKFKDYILPIVPNQIAYMLRGLGTISSGRTNFSKIIKV